MGIQNLQTTSKTKLFARRVFGFRQAVRIKHIAIPWMQRPFKIGVRGFGEHAKEQSIFFNPACRAIRMVAVQNRWVPGAGVADNLGIKVRVQISGGDEVIFKLSAQSLVQSGEDACRVLRVSGLARKGDFEHGSDQRGRNAVPGDVGDENAEMIPFERQEIVEVARDSAHWEIPRGDFDPSPARDVPRQNGCLDLLSNLKLFLDREEALLFGENATGHEIAEGANKKKKASRLQVASANQVEPGEIGMKNEQRENTQAQGNYAEVARKAAGGAEEK